MKVPMILIACTQNNVQLSPDALHSHLSKIPSEHRAQILKYRFWQGLQSCLFGKLLLLKGLEDLSIMDVNLTDIRYTRHHRPYFEHRAIDFNISHSGQYVVCAIARRIRLGIDIEEIKWIDTADLENQFSNEEVSFIRSGDNTLLNFYSLWTKKEALIKANGSGLSLPLQEVVALDNIVNIEHEQWFLTKLEISKNYCCHLATNLNPASAIQIVDYNFHL